MVWGQRNSRKKKHLEAFLQKKMEKSIVWTPPPKKKKKNFREAVARKKSFPPPRIIRGCSIIARAIVQLETLQYTTRTNEFQRSNSWFALFCLYS